MNRQSIENLPKRIPRHAWDSHMHIINPCKYPLATGAQYQPQIHTVEDAKIFEWSLGIDNIVIVQPSIYGYDNSCMLDAMATIGPNRCRGVVVFDPEETSQLVLEEWHRLGVRGVRVNLQSVGKTLDAAELEAVMLRYADAVRTFGWVIQVYIPMHMIPTLEPVVPRLGVRLCIDHIGHPELHHLEDPSKGIQDPYEITGFKSMISLLKDGQTFVKLSAPYRIRGITQDNYTNLGPVVQELLTVAGKSQVVFATDWPHTRFEGLDINPWIVAVLEWCGNDEVLVDRVFRGNAESLWGISVAGK
ncbi:hypothetical protein BX600DRAFT_389619 [Xylariales sp. PMI_506]|nr:hypothetical protein BX600DRAFT_389619 [Xylariales sp. PMI_506]